MLLAGFRLGKLNFPSLGMINTYDALDESWALLGDDVAITDEYLLVLHKTIGLALGSHLPFPVVRFADGEFAFYRASLNVNGLYIQAQSPQQIQNVLPLHVVALKHVAEIGLLCPITYLYSLSWITYDHLLQWVAWLYANDIPFNPNNYVPFYAVYAYLTSLSFMHLIDGKNVLIVGSELQPAEFENWTAQFHVSPHYSYLNIPASYVAVNWQDYREDILQKIDPTVQIALVAAGAGAAVVCDDIATRFNIPAIDAGHVINLMNNQVQKSNGHRLYTFRGIRS